MVRKLSAGPAVEETMPARYAAGWSPGSLQPPAQWRQSFRDWLAATTSPLVTLVDILVAMRRTRAAEEAAGLRPPRPDLSAAPHLVELRPGHWTTAAGLEERRQLLAQEERAAAVAEQRAEVEEAASTPYWQGEDDDVPPWAAQVDRITAPVPASIPRTASQRRDAHPALEPPRPAQRPSALPPDRVEELREQHRAAGTPCDVCGGVVGYLAAPANPASFALTGDGQPAHRYCVTV
ncbi:hypothetical protein [Kocuria marina]|uniref:hypothetical protein n=1 Tax=Kocuria marina TaxID=223184 RepID=UPI000BF18BFA